ncbi:metal-binding protein [Pseudomonas sp. ES4]|uniref:metal-binding protein n=1 Tax=Pseudomonas sp. ES4 TaxID=3424777 RepID=UPI003D32CA38
MGDYTKGLTERRNHTEITKGFCLICGEHGPLSIDHVPPKGSITITRVEQVHLTELLGAKLPSVKGVKSPNGSKFKTICLACNTKHLGANDQEVACVFKELTARIKHHFKYANSPVNHVSVKFDAVKFCRAMIGHILSATSVKECHVDSRGAPYFDPLRAFVMGNDSAIDDTHDIYCWFYPHRRHISAKLFAFRNQGNLCCISLLSFFPLAFSITEKGKGIYPAGATKVLLTDQILHVDLSSGYIQYSSFPLTGLEGDQMLLLTDHMAIVSYPI